VSTLDLVIVGAGPIGLACAIEAHKAGLSYKVIEKGMLVNSIFHFPVNMTFFSTSQLLEIGDVPFIAHGDKPTRREALEYYRRVAESWRLHVNLYERVDTIKTHDAGYRIQTDKARYDTRFVIIATGFYDTANKMNIPGEDLPKVKHYYDEPHPYVQQKIIVVGGGNSAADVAIETYLKGAEVTMVIREAAFKESLKYWIRPNLENRIKEGAIKAYFNSTLTEIREKEADIVTPQGKFTVANDFVLAMTGYRPDYPFLKKIGIAIVNDVNRTPHIDPDTLETNLPGVFMAGVVNGGLNTGRWFIETARIHGPTIIGQIVRRL